jgi:anti-anti-sigma factor
MFEGFEDLELTITRAATGARVRVSGDVDLASVATLRRALHGELQATSGDVIVDLSGTSFCDSVGLGALLTASSDLRATGRTLRLVDPAPCVLRLLQLTATGDQFEIATLRAPGSDLDAAAPDEDGPVL